MLIHHNEKTSPLNADESGVHSEFSDGPSGTHIMLAIAIPICTIMIALLVRNLALNSPILGGDENTYYTMARKLSELHEVSARDPYMLILNDAVFAGLGNLFFGFSQNPVVLMKAFNALFFSLSVLILSIMLHRLSPGRFPLFAPTILALVPLSAYSAYFMPESLYVLIFVGLAAALILLIPEHSLLAACIGGLLNGALLLTKPQGIAIFGAAVLTMLSLLVLRGSARPDWKKVLISTGVFCLSVYASEVGLNWAITGVPSWSPTLFVGISYNSTYSQQLSGIINSSSFFDLLILMGKNAVGHIIILLFICVIPIAFFMGWLVSALSATRSSALAETHGFKQLYILVMFTFLTTAATIAMTVNFTANFSRQAQSPIELDRLHGRLYAFVLFLYLLGYFVLQKKKLPVIQPPGGLRLWAIVGLIASFLMFWAQRAYIIYPWDYAEAFSLSFWPGYGTSFPSWLVIAAGILVYGFIVLKPKFHSILFPIFIFGLFTASSYRIVEWQFAHARVWQTLTEQGRALRDLIPEAERSRGTIIGEDRYGKMSYFLFGFASDAWVRVVPEGENITLDMLPPDTDWVILLGDYDLNFPVKASLNTGETWLGWLSPNSPVVHEYVDPWDGKPLEYKFGTGGSSYMLDQFNPPEEWGAWSATDDARIILPVLVSGKIRIEIVGWKKPESAKQPLSLLVGATTAPLQFGTANGTSCIIVDLPEPTRVLTLHGVDPVQPTPWDPPQAVALAAIRIDKESNGSEEACSPYTPLK